jgi:hypothetical protein
MRQYDDYRNIGSAGMLIGNQKLLFIFVDDDGATPWTHELRKPIEEKIESSLRWLEKRANGFEKPLRIMHKCLPLPPNIASNAGGLINENDYTACPHHVTWQRDIASSLITGGSLAERWNELFELAGLPLNEGDGSVILFFVRRHVPSVAFRYCVGQHPEFEKERAIIYDMGGVGGQTYLDSLIAHEILHLYGAEDFAPEKVHESLKEIARELSDDVMHTPTQKPINEYDVSEVTAYLVGWLDESALLLNDNQTEKSWFLDS